MRWLDSPGPVEGVVGTLSLGLCATAAGAAGARPEVAVLPLLGAAWVASRMHKRDRAEVAAEDGDDSLDRPDRDGLDSHPLDPDPARTDGGTEPEGATDEQMRESIPDMTGGDR